MISLDQCQAWDRADALGSLRDRFEMPAGIIYLDGNSLGALPTAVKARLADTLDREWGRDLIRSWNTAGWIDLPERVGARIAPLIGAAPDEVIVAESVSVNIFKLATAALALRPSRRVILSEAGNFPTDLYMLQGLKALLGDRVDVRIVARGDLAKALDEDVALLLLTHVHYRSAELFDMAGWTKAAHDVGALTLWDLSHSTGAVTVDLNGCNADLAVGCGYKYLCGGPGAPAFSFVAKRHQPHVRQPLSGWMGHARPFDFVDAYEPAPGMKQQLCGTPQILSLAALDAALEVFEGITADDLWQKGQALGELLIKLMTQECGDFGFQLASPRENDRRGCHASFRHPQAYAICQALIDRGVIGDFRAPDVLRLGLAPLTTRYSDIWHAVATLKDLMVAEAWDQPAFHKRAAVT